MDNEVSDGHQQKKSSLTPTLILTTFLTCFGSSMLYGYNIAVMNLPGNQIKCFFNQTVLGVMCDPKYQPPGYANRTIDIDSSKKTTMDANILYSLTSTIFVVCGAAGAFLTGWFSDFFGRRNGLLVNHAFVIIGAIFMGPTVAAGLSSILFVGRAFVGFNCGITIGLASMFLTEIAPRDVRGAIGACHQLAVTLGIVIGYIMTLSSLLNSYQLWPIACALTAVPAVISLCLLPFCPESPRYIFLKKHDHEGARKAFLRVNQTENVDLFLAELQEEVEFTKSQPVFRFTQLFTQRDLRMPLTIACLIQVMQQLSGINAVVSYSNLMLTTAGVSDASLEYCVLAIGILNVICTIVSLPMLERFGRRTLLLWPSLLLAVTLALLTVFVNLANSSSIEVSTKKVMGILSTIMVLVYTAGFALGLGPVPALIVAEIFRQGPRGAAYSISQGIQWTSALIVLTCFPIMNNAMQGYSFLPFLVVVVCCWIFFFLFMPETRGRTFDDVARDLAFGNMVIFKRSATFPPEMEMEGKGDPGVDKPLLGAINDRQKEEAKKDGSFC